MQDVLRNIMQHLDEVYTNGGLSRLYNQGGLWVWPGPLGFVDDPLSVCTCLEVVVC